MQFLVGKHSSRLFDAVTLLTVTFSLLFFCLAFPQTKALAATKTNYYSEALSVVTTTSTSFVDVDAVNGQITFTPEDNSTYMVVASMQGKNSSNTNSPYGEWRLRRSTGTPRDFSTPETNTSTYLNFSIVGYDTFGASPGSQTYIMQHRSTDVSRTTSTKEVRIFAIKLDSADQKAQGLGSTSGSSSYTNQATLTFTPASTGDYYIFASQEVTNNSGSQTVSSALDIDGTNYSVDPLVANTLWQSYSVIKKVNLSNASHTIRVKYKDDSGFISVNARNASIVALRADQFDNVFYAEDETPATTTSSTYSDDTTLTQTPEANTYLIVNTATLTSGGSTPNVKFLSNATSVIDTQNDSKNFFLVARRDETAISTTWKLQYRNEDNSTSTGITDDRIAVFQLVASAPAPTPVPAATSSSSTSPPVTPTCNDSTPSIVPNLFQADPAGTYVNVYFTTVKGASGYNINYGPTSEANQYSDKFSYNGPLWVYGRKIGSLNPDTNYYFRIQALNGCSGSTWSKVLITKTQGKLTDVTQFFANLNPFKSTPTPTSNTPTTPTGCTNYTVQKDDTLWDIATSSLGNGSLYNNIISQNPGLTTTLQIGQLLNICK